MWLPCFACPECGNGLDGVTSSALRCAVCARDFELRDGCYRFLTQRRQAAMEPFLRQYRTVRERDGYRVSQPAYYRLLPSVPLGDPHATEWQLRRESFQYLHCQILAAGSQLCVLDVGAGNGWLSHRLASLGHRLVAVDTLDDDQDGLGACRHYETPFPCVHADFDAPPFAPRQFDLVVFNGSLHYSPDVAATLARARRLLVPGGALVVMDSPMFRSESDGNQMVTEKLRRFRTEYGLTEIVHPNVGFLTFAELARESEALGLRGRFFPSRGPLAWRVRRRIGSLRRRRAAATFGVWVAR